MKLPPNAINKLLNSRALKITGLTTALGYLLVILALWIYTSIQGYTYFRGGEPLWYIKYPEWLAGIIALYILYSSLKQEVNAAIRSKRRFDPYV